VPLLAGELKALCGSNWVAPGRLCETVQFSVYLYIHKSVHHVYCCQKVNSKCSRRLLNY